MNQNWTGTSAKGTGNIKIQNFLEALRNSQNSEVLSSKNEVSQSRNIIAEIQAKKEIEKKRIEQFHLQRTQEWNKIFSSKEIQTEKKIEYLRQELQKLSKQLKRLDTNIQKAVQSPIVDGGVYQENYLEHLKKIIHLFGLKVSQANSWLEVYQNRSMKQGSYWSMANIKGSSYTQNNERSIATSVG